MRTVYLTVLLCGLAPGQVNHPRPGQMPTCTGAGGTPQWSAKLLSKDSVRFTIDAHEVDTCTVFWDIEFVAELFDSKGTSIGTRLFDVPNLVINGPRIDSFDFPCAGLSLSKVTGISLKCKKRTIGGLPMQPMEPPAFDLGTALGEDFVSEKKTYDHWEMGYDAEYLETYAVGSDRMQCSSGSVVKQAKQGDSAACADVRRAADELAAARRKSFGDPILPVAKPMALPH